MEKPVHHLWRQDRGVAGQIRPGEEQTSVEP